MNMKTSKQQVMKDGYRFSGNAHGLMTLIQVEVPGVVFVDGMVEATIRMGASEPMKVRFTYEQALAADLIERV